MTYVYHFHNVFYVKHPNIVQYFLYYNKIFNHNIVLISFCFIRNGTFFISDNGYGDCYCLRHLLTAAEHLKLLVPQTFEPRV